MRIPYNKESPVQLPRQLTSHGTRSLSNLGGAHRYPFFTVDKAPPAPYCEDGVDNNGVDNDGVDNDGG
jgi:hypothetical protein